MQSPGTALRMSFARLERLFVREPSLLHLVLRSVQSDFLTASQLSACNRVHAAEARLARWLLMIQDQTGESGINVTQHAIGEALGVRRSSVNAIAVKFQGEGFISYRRSFVQIVDRKGLEATACECYPTVRKLLNDLYVRGEAEVSFDAASASQMSPSTLPAQVASASKGAESCR